MKKNKIYALIFSIAFSIACQDKTQAVRVTGNPQSSNANAQEPSPNPTPIDPKFLCDRVPQIKILPFKGEQGKDATYDSLMVAGDAVIPCLIDRVTDVTPMQDPRESLKFEDTRVGDIAYFVLTDITGMDFTAPLPTRVKREYKDEGVYAYFRFVEKLENRQKIQNALRAWFKKSHHK